MIAFATEFPIQQSADGPKVLRVVREWLLGSPHTQFNDTDIADLDSANRFDVSRNRERLERIVTKSDAGDDAIGVRYHRSDGELVWRTSIVYAGDENAAWVALRIVCESESPSAYLPEAKKPVLIRSLLETLGGGFDGPLNVTSTPHILDVVEVSRAADLINGKCGCHLPIVYVSSTSDSRHTVDTARLASQLGGMAHVIVEPDRQFSFRLQIDTASKNVYGGTIGIYWPAGTGRRAFFLGNHYESPQTIELAIVKEIRTALINRRPRQDCTWASVQSNAAKHATASLKSAGSKELEKYLEEFDHEVDAKSQLLEDAETEIRWLRSEIERLAAYEQTTAGLSLQRGTEQDMYPGEIMSIVLDVLKKARPVKDSRREHVLDAVLNANVQPDETSGFRDELKDLLRGSRKMDRRIRRGLEKMGFAITGEGKHYKLVFRGDDRYTFALPKTSSDNRAGLNAAGDISRLMF